MDMPCIGADFQHSLPPAREADNSFMDDRLTGGASLRDYFAAQALRSHYIIQRTSDRDVEYLGKLCYEIADSMLSNS